VSVSGKNGHKEHKEHKEHMEYTKTEPNDLCALCGEKYSVPDIAAGAYPAGVFNVID
jgi:hypothetical protein